MTDIFLNSLELRKNAELQRRLAVLESRNARSPQRAVGRQTDTSAWVTPTDYANVTVMTVDLYVPIEAVVFISFGCRFRTYSAGATGDATLELDEITEGLDLNFTYPQLTLAKGYYGNPSEAGLRFTHLHYYYPRGGETGVPVAVRQNEGTRTFRVRLRQSTGIPHAEITKSWLALEAR